MERFTELIFDAIKDKREAIRLYNEILKATSFDTSFDIIEKIKGIRRQEKIHLKILEDIYDKCD